MSNEDFVRLAAVRRVATRAGAVRFNAAIGSIIGADVSNDTTIERSATLTRLLSLYNQMRAAKLYGQVDQFKAASAAMADAIDKYSQKSPGGADKIREVVKKLTFSDEENQRKKALEAKNKKDSKSSK
jgi:hypothetical protein